MTPPGSHAIKLTVPTKIEMVTPYIPIALFILVAIGFAVVTLLVAWHVGQVRAMLKNPC